MSRFMCTTVALLGFLMVQLNAFTMPLPSSNPTRSSSTLLHMAGLKPAAMPLMDAGKAFARSGEFVVDLCSQMDLYGGALSQAGASIRNSGDSIAQAAASCRFKTGLELVCDEFRESGTCLIEATLKLKQAVKEAKIDENDELARLLADSVLPMDELATALEEAGKSIMQGKTVKEIGICFVKSGDCMETLSIQIRGYAPQFEESSDAAQRMAFAGERMREAGYELTGTSPEVNTPKGKGWIKG